MSKSALTKVEAGIRAVWLEHSSTGFGVEVCSFLHQLLHIIRVPSLDGNVESRLTYR